MLQVWNAGQLETTLQKTLARGLTSRNEMHDIIWTFESMLMET